MSEQADLHTRNNSPLEISIILHYHVSPEPWPNPGDLADSITDMYFREGLLKESKLASGYETTEKGRAWVAMICSTPYPLRAWIDPRTQELVKL